MRALVSETVRTPRMRGERLRPEHEPELGALDLDPQVYATLWPLPRPPTAADVHAALLRQTDHWERHGFGLWLMRDADTGEMVGRGGLLHTQVEDAPVVEVAWAIVSERWNQGLATELADAAVRAGFEQLGRDELVALTLPHNGPSRRVMEKMGFAYAGETQHAGLWHVLYRLPRGRWDS